MAGIVPQARYNTHIYTGKQIITAPAARVQIINDNGIDK